MPCSACREYMFDSRCKKLHVEATFVFKVPIPTACSEPERILDPRMSMCNSSGLMQHRSFCLDICAYHSAPVMLESTIDLQKSRPVSVTQTKSWKASGRVVVVLGVRQRGILVVRRLMEVPLSRPLNLGMKRGLRVALFQTINLGCPYVIAIASSRFCCDKRKTLVLPLLGFRRR